MKNITKKMLSLCMISSLVVVSLSTISTPAYTDIKNGTYTYEDGQGGKFSYTIKRVSTGTGHGTDQQCILNSNNGTPEPYVDNSPTDDYSCFSDTNGYELEWSYKASAKALSMPSLRLSSENSSTIFDKIESNDIDTAFGNGNIIGNDKMSFKENTSGSGIVSFNYRFKEKDANAGETKINGLNIPAPVVQVGNLSKTKIKGDKGFTIIEAPFVDLYVEQDLRQSDSHGFYGDFYSFTVIPKLRDLKIKNDKGSKRYPLTSDNYKIKDGIKLKISTPLPAGTKYLLNKILIPMPTSQEIIIPDINTNVDILYPRNLIPDGKTLIDFRIDPISDITRVYKSKETSSNFNDLNKFEIGYTDDCSKLLESPHYEIVKSRYEDIPNNNCNRATLIRKNESTFIKENKALNGGVEIPSLPNEPKEKNVIALPRDIADDNPNTYFETVLSFDKAWDDSHSKAYFCDFWDPEQESYRMNELPYNPSGSPQDGGVTVTHNGIERGKLLNNKEVLFVRTLEMASSMPDPTSECDSNYIFTYWQHYHNYIKIPLEKRSPVVGVMISTDYYDSYDGVLEFSIPKQSKYEESMNSPIETNIRNKAVVRYEQPYGVLTSKTKSIENYYNAVSNIIQGETILNAPKVVNINNKEKIDISFENKLLPIDLRLKVKFDKCANDVIIAPVNGKKWILKKEVEDSSECGISNSYWYLDITKEESKKIITSQATFTPSNKLKRGDSISYESSFNHVVDLENYINQGYNKSFKISLIGGSFIGDFVWNDSNKNGLQDLDEKGMKNIKVQLLDEKNKLVKETITDDNGKYKFDDLKENKSYIIKVILPKNYQFTKSHLGKYRELDSNIYENGLSNLIKVQRNNENNTVDAGLYYEKESILPPILDEDKGSMNGRVWNDSNKNGLQCKGETGINNVKIYLIDIDSKKVMHIMNTDESGLYSFKKIKQGKYQIKIDIPNGWKVTSMDTGSDDKIDSDADSSGTIRLISLLKDQEIKHLDIGLVSNPSTSGNTDVDECIKDANDEDSGNKTPTKNDNNSQPNKDNGQSDYKTPTLENTGFESNLIFIGGGLLLIGGLFIIFSRVRSKKQNKN